MTKQEMQKRLREIDKQYRGKSFPNEIHMEVTYLERQLERIIDND